MALFVSRDSYVFSTYDYGNLEISDDDQANTEYNSRYNDNFGDWAFFYFGYSFKTKQAYAYVKYRDREDSYLFQPVYHFIPNFMRVYLGNDGLYP